MRRRPLALVLTAALIGAVFTALPAKAATEVPATVNIEDPANDGNALNDQGAGMGIGDNSGGGNFGGADILKVWFTNTDANINVHVLNSTVPGGGNFAYIYRVLANDDCVWFEGKVDGATNPSANYAVVSDECGDAGTAEGTIAVEELEGGNGLVTMTFPIGSAPYLAINSSLVGPLAHTRLHLPSGNTAPQLDDTKVGTDFTITGGGDVEPPVVEEPKPAKDPCKKLKGKKKKKCLKKNASKPCTAYAPGEKGAEAETSVVTDAATAEAPVEVPLTMDPSVGAFSGEVQGQSNPLVSHAIQNVQVDTAAADSGLYVRVEFPEGEDYDLYLFDAEGNDAAHAGGGNQAPEELGDGTGNGGHSETTAEQLDGVKTTDCGGYTVDVANAIGMGEATLKFWLGPATWDPAAQAPIESGPSKALVF